MADHESGQSITLDWQFFGENGPEWLHDVLTQEERTIVRMKGESKAAFRQRINDRWDALEKQYKPLQEEDPDKQ